MLSHEGLNLFHSVQENKTTKAYEHEDTIDLTGGTSPHYETSPAHSLDGGWSPPIVPLGSLNVE